MIAALKPKHRHQEFLAFLHQIDRASVDAVDEHGDPVELHLVMDNYAAHKHANVKVWLAQHPRFKVHFTPPHASWMNLVEVWFGLVERQAVRRGVFKSVKDLNAKLRGYIEGWNKRAHPFVPTKTAEEILKKSQPSNNFKSAPPGSCGMGTPTLCAHPIYRKLQLENPENKMNQRAWCYRHSATRLCCQHAVLSLGIQEFHDSLSEAHMSKPRVRMQPEQRRAQIIQVAHTIMVEQGGNALTLRAVAAGCDVSLAAIQHHFRDKGELFQAVIESISAEYERRYSSAISATVHEPEERLRQFVEFLVCDDINLRSTAGFFYELWAMAFHDPIAQGMMTRLYDIQLIRIRDMIQSANINLSDREALVRAGTIVAAADGLMMTIGAGKDTVLGQEPSVANTMVDILMGIVWQPVTGLPVVETATGRRRA